MRLTSISVIALISTGLSQAAAQTTITRTEQFTFAQDTEDIDDTPDVATSQYHVMYVSKAGGVPTGRPSEGFRLKDLSFAASCSIEIILDATAVDPQGSTLRAEGAITDQACLLGDSSFYDYYVDGSYIETFGAAPNYLQSGEAVTFSRTFFGGASGGVSDPNYFQWFQSGQFHYSLLVDAALSGANPSGSQAFFRFDRVVRRTSLQFNVSGTYELDEVPSMTFCQSLPNATGQNGSLMFFGSRFTGLGMTSAVATSLPSDSASILFLGTQEAFFPTATYNLCVSGIVSRVGGVQVSSGGQAQFDFDLADYPVGTTLCAQVIHRDPTVTIAATNGEQFLVQ